jgi:[acyl-carrier-protein] S-malonyltransferase
MLGAAGVLELPSLLTLINERARLMQEACEATPGAMYAVIGFDDDRLLDIVGQPRYAGQVFAVNFNCPGQTVIAGFEAPAAACAEELTAAGARKPRRLNVSGAFHTPLMEPAAQKLAVFARGLTFHEPAGAIYTNTSGARMPAGTDWPAYLASHMCGPVRWTREILNMQQDGCHTFIEFGPGKVLAGLIRKILPDGTAALPVEDSVTLAAALAAVAG